MCVFDTFFIIHKWRFVESVGFVEAVPRKRLRSIIKRQPEPFDVYRDQNQAIFKVALWLYLQSRFAPSISACNFDETAYTRRWTATRCHWCIDYERAVIRALESNPTALDQFWSWFIVPLIEPDAEGPGLFGADARKHSQMIQKIARELRKIGFSYLADQRYVKAATFYLEEQS